ncbi:MFS transporter [Deinococcus maricopensis]|uniref:Major facilitator superfamily MFS_1 n=1 Tax=Deinococcus maricopensis (strain DSM 21211 / LMG 22137 / NRRL B-23946 / LB-34) TaxID=709986 RepID=E8U3Q1_DEIML|nr:MFS transporter [Deinococcus maricopensis]ADV68675.1 major facilitator superfamily MFS_1 [Deinococcus maricopensis DSM 21211]
MSTPASPVTAPQRALLLSNFLMWAGFFMVIPLVTVHYVDRLGWAAASIGAVLAARQLTQQGLTVLGGALADRFGPRGLILAGCLIRALGFAWMGFAGTFPVLLAASVLAGLGGSLFDAPKNAATTTLTPEPDRPRMFARMGVAGNLGMVTGPLIGGLLADVDFRIVAVAAGSVYVLAWAVLAATLPAMRPAANARGGLSALAVPLRDRRFLGFTALMSGYFLLSTQLNVAITLLAVHLGGVRAPSLVYALNAGLAVFLQLPLTRLAARHFPPRLVLVGGITLTALALGSVSFAHTLPALLASVTAFSLGTMLVFPTQQTLTADLARPGLYGSYFGVGALSLGVGGAVGNLIGGTLIDAGARLHLPALPWITLMLLGLLSAAGLLLAVKDPEQTQEA